MTWWTAYCAWPDMFQPPGVQPVEEIDVEAYDEDEARIKVEVQLSNPDYWEPGGRVIAVTVPPMMVWSLS